MSHATPKQSTDINAAALQQRLDVSKGTALKLLVNGEFPNAYRITRDWRIPESDIAAYIDRRRQAAKDERALRSAGKKLPAAS